METDNLNVEYGTLGTIAIVCSISRNYGLLIFGVCLLLKAWRERKKP